MTEVIIRDVPIKFPFTPYKVQEDYMSKVLECLQTGVNGVLESPTGTGKTLSLLCSSLAWLQAKKAQAQATAQGLLLNNDSQQTFNTTLQAELKKSTGVPESSGDAMWSERLATPHIIYASRTHSQLTQVMKELKRSGYSHVKAAILGSRDQLCLHPDLSQEQGFMKVTMCRAKVRERTCHFYNNFDTNKMDKGFAPPEVVDIEDLVKFGNKRQCCPYYLARELTTSADITFMPYNYLLNPQTRQQQRLDLNNAVVILDEAHNVEKMCEESASVHFSSTDIALCINEVTQAMKKFSDNLNQESDGDTEMDFKMEDLCLLKTMFLALEKAVDEIELDTVKEEGPNKGKKAGRTFPGSYIFGLLGKAELRKLSLQLAGPWLSVYGLHSSIVRDQALTGLAQFLSTTSDSPLASKGNMLVIYTIVCSDSRRENVPVIDQALTGLAQFLSTTSDSPLASKGNMLVRFNEFLKVVYASCGPQGVKNNSDLFYKVYIEPEVPKKAKPDSWSSSKTTLNSNAKDEISAEAGGSLHSPDQWKPCRLYMLPSLSWAFPSLYNLRTLTSLSHLSGTLSPLHATISELGIPIPVQLENPHIIEPSQWKPCRLYMLPSLSWAFPFLYNLRTLTSLSHLSGTLSPLHATISELGIPIPLHSIVLTSGTLSPLHATISELGIPIPVQLENPHIIEPSQISVNVLNKGPTGEKLISTFANRENPKYLGDLGRMLTNFCRVVPDGVLMFFPSYPLMEKTINLWQQEGFWSQIIALKPLFVEPQYRDRLADVMKEYNSALEAEDSRGAVFLAVLRGKVSEGMDFADARCRAVIITGLPYPPFKDPRIILKREYVDNLRKTDPKALSGNEWYQLEATRAVNQAVGRVIRHGSDFGAIMLCDCRFESSNITNSLSAWVRPHINKCQEFGLAYGRVSKFFKSMGIAPQTRPIQSGASFDSVEGKVRIKEKAEKPRKENLSQNSMQQFLEKVLQTQPKTKTSAQPSPSGLFDAIDVSASQSESRKKDILRKCFNQPKEEPTQPQVLPVAKKRKLQIVPLKFDSSEPSSSEAERSKTSMEYIREVKSRISDDNFLQLKNAVKAYAHPQQSNYNNTILCLRKVFPDSKTKDLFIGFKRYIKAEHLKQFEELCLKLFGSTT
ncbi:LOW QUALITY PROTEIN: regulator of telomere elongation helicase 1 homolog [Homalodisca vitripennis]|uniref:LOW QUALITY PROTEIN: regulator of telomere elongation helicase 1 homolog n=1 Tax=Homalodisca vitripennis TaxID=197043 RepID=UPI001EEB6634|nr:LOW QUALITY PROTEIN: regulator of telomere elongation helicase 1 homolog [Homalodisca vitripennis]